MKKLYLSILILFISVGSRSQKYASNTYEAQLKGHQIIAIEEIENESEIDFEYRYYYFPNLYAYYDLETKNYIYMVNNKWETNSVLPQYYGGYSLYKNVRVPIKEYCDDSPQEYLKEHKKQYPYIKKSRMLKSLYIDNNSALSGID